ncbi:MULTISPECIES: hypothetical protein [Spirosoma]|uniref:Uncharacterized protein n=1 Tax=Spirosoma sordidisoli TaxID=2502893 RepID=A0A4Q2UVP5_9BACT|nr:MULTISPECIES: hypothetical protein [Spirosoma]RYC71935.1 hypothetical protein EQG79_07375 [Spirosoma sordidisoli]
MDLNVLPECYIDTKLVKALVPPKRQYNHQKGTNVLKIMKESLADEFALGIVDEDVQDREYAQNFDSIYHIEGCLRLLKHSTRPHFLIYLCPAVERWIIFCADEAQISLTTYGLPHDFDKLRKISKTSKSEDRDPHSDNFQKLFRALRQSNSPSVSILQLWVNYLKTNPYTADVNWLIDETNRLR